MVQRRSNLDGFGPTPPPAENNSSPLLKATLDEFCAPGRVRLLFSRPDHLQAADQTAGRIMADDPGVPLVQVGQSALQDDP